MKHKLLSIGLGMTLGFSAQAWSANINENLFIGGYTSFEYELQFEEKGKSDPMGSFDADLFDLVIAYQASDRVRVAADLTWEHGAASEDGLGNVAVEYAYPEFLVNNNLKIRAGKMFTAFGIYNEIHTAKPAFLSVKEPLSTNKPHKFGSGDGIPFFPRWQTGFAFLGDFDVGDHTLSYNLQVSNGDAAVKVGDEFELISLYDKDVDLAKALNGRLVFTTENENAFAVSFYWDNMVIVTGEDGEDLEDVSQIANSIDDGTAIGNLTRSSVSAHSTGFIGPLGYEVEFIYGILDGQHPAELEDSEGEGTGEFVLDRFERKRYGSSAMLYYPMGMTFTPYVRHEFLEPDMDVENDLAHAVSLGLNTRLDANLFLKTEYRVTRAEEDNDRFKKGNNEFSEFAAAIALGF